MERELMSTTSNDLRSAGDENVRGVSLQLVPVWDLPTRIFHWLIVVLVIVAWVTSEEKGLAFVLHSLAGYALIAALIFRFAWGFVGGSYARFSSFLQPWPVVASYTKQLIRRKPARYIGHNPLGGWMVILLLIVLAGIVTSGLFARGGGVAGPWADINIGLSTRQWYEIHEVLFEVLSALIALHIIGVVVDQLLTGDKLVRAMFTGSKLVPANEPVDATQPGIGKALAIVIIAVIATGFIVGWQLPGSDGKRAIGSTHAPRTDYGAQSRSSRIAYEDRGDIRAPPGATIRLAHN
jgi:cytochrome b